MTQIQINSETVTKILSTIDQGLTQGLGNPVPGQMCVEAAICYSLGLEHGDDPKCVAPSIRALKIRLNDSNWSSDTARAKGLRKLAVLQLGTSNNFSDSIFATKVVMLVVNKYLPIALKFMKIDNSIINNCKEASNLKEAAAAAAVAEAAAHAAAAYAVAVAAAYAVAAASTAASATAAAAEAAAYAAASAAAHAAAVAAAEAILFNFAEDVTSILIEMQVPGLQWLDLL